MLVFFKTFSRIAGQFFWNNMRQDIRRFIRECDVCQRAKVQQTLPAGLLQPLPIPTAIWEDVATNLIIGLPKSHGFIVILVVVNHLSKYGHFTPLGTDFNAVTVAEAFIKNVVRLHGILSLLSLTVTKSSRANFGTIYLNCRGPL